MGGKKEEENQAAPLDTIYESLTFCYVLLRRAVFVCSHGALSVVGSIIFVQ